MQSPSSTATDPSATNLDLRTAKALTAVAAAVERLSYGAIHLTVHDGRVVQIEVTEKQRFS